MEGHENKKNTTAEETRTTPITDHEKKMVKERKKMYAWQ